MGSARDWHFIEDLPEDWQRLASSELEGVQKIWRGQSQRLGATDSGRRFNERLRREWAIETGVIESLYTIDRGITQLLIEKGIEASLIPYGATNQPTELVVAIVKDQEAALEDLFEFVNHKRRLTTSYIKQLHQLFTQHQDTVEAKFSDGRTADVLLLKGEWKKLPNSPTRRDGVLHQYTPPEHVASEMDSLLSLHEKHEAANVAPEVEAAWLHHRFTQIHPFQDGNGRIARALASLVFIRARLFPLVITRDTRSDYIKALEAADDDDLSPLVALFVDMQTKAFRQAVSISEPLLRQSESISDIIAAGAKSLRSKRETQQTSLDAVFVLAEELKQRAMAIFDETAQTLDSELKTVERDYSAVSDASRPESRLWFRHEIVEIAKAKPEDGINYYPDLLKYSEWTRIMIRIAGRTTNIVLSLHSLGVDFLGVIVASAFIEFRDLSGDDETRIDGPYAVSRNIFQFGYDEEPNGVKARFESWLNEVVLIGLDEWRKQL